MTLAKSDFDSWTSFWLVFETWKGLKIGSLSFLLESDFEGIGEIEGTEMVEDEQGTQWKSISSEQQVKEWMESITKSPELISVILT